MNQYKYICYTLSLTMLASLLSGCTELTLQEPYVSNYSEETYYVHPTPTTTGHNTYYTKQRPYQPQYRYSQQENYIHQNVQQNNIKHSRKKYKTYNHYNPQVVQQVQQVQVHQAPAHMVHQAPAHVVQQVQVHQAPAHVVHQPAHVVHQAPARPHSEREQQIASDHAMAVRLQNEENNRAAQAQQIASDHAMAVRLQNEENSRAARAQQIASDHAMAVRLQNGR